MSEHAPDRLWAGIDIPKTIAGVLAAVSAAVVGSFLGVAGTLVGAALASIVGSVGTEIYHRSIERGKQRLQASFVTAPAAVGTPTVVASEQDSPSEPEPKAAKKYRWGRVAMVAGALFVLAMGALSAFELAAGKTAADAVTGKAGSGTTVGDVLGGNDKKDNSGTTKPAGDATPTGTATTEPGTNPSGAATTEPGTGPSGAGTTNPEPTSTGTTTTAPPAVDSGTGDQGVQNDGTGGAGGGASADSVGGSGGGASADSVDGSRDGLNADTGGGAAGSAGTPEPGNSGE